MTRIAFRQRALARRFGGAGLWLAAAVVLAVVATGGIAGQSASADDYPSWDDVQAARANEAATAAEVTRVQGLLTGLQADVTSSQAAAQTAGDAYQDAQQKYDEAAFKAAALQKQADDAAATASASRLQAGQLAARLSRSGGGDIPATLFFSGGKASSGLLDQLGMASLVKNQSAGLYAKAVQDQNTAQSLTDQADVAKTALKVLADAAAKALEVATAAATKAADALTAQTDNEARLKAQLATLQTNTLHAESEYIAGITAKWGADASLAAGKISETGWVKPAGGPISSPFGWRINPFTHSYAFHAGTDLAAACGSPIFAAHSGTVAYAGWNGGYGNFVLVDNGDGTSTGYGHIVNGGILVAIGQSVGPGQNIALVGSTGHSTGCHLHYEVRINGVATDAVPFMRTNGINLAG